MASSRLSMRVSTGDATYRLLPEMFKHKLVQIAEESVASLQKIWEEAGYEEMERQRLLGELLNKLKITCANEITAEEQILMHARQEVETLMTDYVTKNAQLGRTAKISDKIAQMNLTDKLSELDRMLSGLTKEVQERQSLFDQEMRVITSIAQELGENLPAANAFDGPAGTPTLSDLRLTLMRDHRAGLETLKAQRRHEVEAVYRDCHAQMVDMSFLEEANDPDNIDAQYKDIDAAILRYARVASANPQATDLPLGSLHKSHLASVKQRLELLRTEKEHRRSELSKTGEEIARLWSLLRITHAERDQFTASFRKNLSLETLRKGYSELTRLRELRKQSLGQVLQVLRGDIENLWVECGMLSAPFASSEATAATAAEEALCQQEFPGFFVSIEDSNDVDESILDEHEQYFSTLRTRVEELRPLLLKIHRREVIVQERLELEHLQMNPERLTARGPNAREERKREEGMTNRVKNLDKLTKEIANAIAAYEASGANGENKVFLYGGTRYSERVQQQDEHWLEVRDNLRSSRKRTTTAAGGSNGGSTNNMSNTAGSSNNNSNSNTSGNQSGGNSGSRASTRPATTATSLTSSSQSTPSTPHHSTSGAARSFLSGNSTSASNNRAQLMTASKSTVIMSASQTDEAENHVPNRGKFHCMQLQCALLP